MHRGFVLRGLVAARSAVAATALLTFAAGGLSGALAEEPVVLPDGSRVDMNGQGPGLLASSDRGELELAVWQLADAGRAADSVAVLAYVARHRPNLAESLALLGMELASDLDDPLLAGLVISAVAAESKTSASRLLGTMEGAGFPSHLLAAAASSVAPTAAAADPLPSDGEGGPPGPVADFAGTGAAPAGGVAGLGPLPFGLVIGNLTLPGVGDPGDGPPDIDDPPEDGGVSG